MQAIVTAAAICVGKNGYEGTSLRQIADTAGVGVGSIYEYFSDKETIYTAMYMSVIRDTVSLIDELIPELVKLDTQSAITELLIRFRAFVQQNDELYLKVIQQSAGRKVSVKSDSVQDVLSRFLVQYILQNPEVSKVENIPAISYILINGGMSVVIKHIADPNPPITFEALAKTFGDIVVSYAQLFTKK